MKRSLRRAVSLLCVLALCIGLLPSTALAWGPGDTEQTQTVYVYLQVVNEDGSELTDDQIRELNLSTINDHGYFTIGTIQVALPAASANETGNGEDRYSQNTGAITAALNEIRRYPANSDCSISDVTWYTLHAASGADDYNVSEYCWHLDGKITIEKIEYVSVTYTDGVDDKEIFADQTTNVIKGTQPTAYNGSTPTRDGYTFKGWTSSLDNGTSNEKVYSSDDIANTTVDQDVIYTAVWEPDVPPTPDITVTKELTSVVRDGKTITEGLSDSKVLYEGDKLTWTITVTNNTESAISFKIEDSLQLEKVLTAEVSDEVEKTLEVKDGSGQFNPDWITVQPGYSKELTASYTVDEEFDVAGYTLTNTATVTYQEKKCTASATNNVGYTIKVTYDGNGGTVNGEDTKTDVHRVTSLPASVTVASDANGFTREGYNFAGWYTQQTDGEKVTEPQSLSGDVTYYAHWTENKKTYGAGYFVLVPSAIPDGFDPTEGYSVDTYLPNTEGDTVTYGDDTNHKVDNTTGYIGYITQAAVDYWQQNNEGDDRVVIPADKISDFLRMPEEAGWGKVWTEYLSKTDVDDKALYTLVPYQINNHSLGVNWPNITPQTDGKYETKEVGYHVDCYIQGVEINVLYVKNDGSTMTYTHNQVNGNPIRSGDTYTVLGNDETGDNQNFILEGYTFTGWNTQADGSGTAYAAGKEISPLMNSLVLYAQWKKNDGATKDLSYTVEYYKDGEKQDSDTQIVNQEVWVNDPDTLTVKKDEINITNKYEGYTFSYSEPTDIPDTITSGSTIKVYYVKADTPDYTVTIQPADITIYTGGEPYGGITDAIGNIIEEASGLPEPGYHLELSDDVIDWLNEKINIEGEEDGPRILADYLTFTYNVGNVTREWDLSYVGVYDVDEETGEPTRYVYSLEPGVDENGEEIPVRLLFRDESGEVAYDDIIGMAENSVCEEYTMSINPGTLTQSEIKAVFTVPGEDPLTCGIAIQPGTLTIRSTTDEEYVNDIGANADGILADGNVTYYVNDSGVTVSGDRVGLLVDEVSNNAAFNREMAQDAMDHAIDSSATDWTHRSDLSYDMAYLDLVDTDNGHAVVTMGEGDSLTIYWPLPADADPYGDFHVVHYTGMDRENTMDESGLDNAAKEILTGRAVRIDGRWYVAFDADSFSPFVLVYEEEDNDRPTRPDPDPDDDKDDEDEEPEEDLSGLNTTDHYAYIAGYEDGTVRPDGNITRAEVATIFFRLMTDEYRETCWSTSSGFTDVTAASWYNNAISTTASAGWVSGYPDGTFRPDAYITRAEFATIAARFLSDVYSGTSMFTDISGHWAEDYINRAAAAGWINGYADGTFRPNAYITRAEAVTLINRMLDRAPDANHLLADMVRWPDNPETAWYYADIQEATNSHDYTRAGTGNYEVWTELLANRDWAALEEIWSQANDAPGGEVADGLTPNGN